jgi:AcrR family transcriptional regulator
MPAKSTVAADTGATVSDDRFADIRELLSGLTPRERLLLVAERMFAEEGLAAVSIRAITAAARVNLASLHYHFGSKEGLLESIFQVRSKPIADERMRMLADCVEAPGRPPLLEQLLTAFLLPALTIGVEPRFGGPAFTRLRARLSMEPEAVSRRILGKAFDESSRAFLHAIERALPEVPKLEISWRFHFLLGTMVYSMASTGRIQSITRGACDPADGTTTLSHLIPFLAAGFRNPSFGSKPMVKEIAKR